VRVCEVIVKGLEGIGLQATFGGIGGMLQQHFRRE
jgi:hypothetical protein